MLYGRRLTLTVKTAIPNYSNLIKHDARETRRSLKKLMNEQGPVVHPGYALNHSPVSEIVNRVDVIKSSMHNHEQSLRGIDRLVVLATTLTGNFSYEDAQHYQTDRIRYSPPPGLTFVDLWRPLNVII